MSRSLNRTSLIALAVLAAAAVALLVALAGGEPTEAVAAKHAPAKHHAAKHHRRAHKAGNACGTRGADPRACTVAPGQAPPVLGTIDAAQLAATGSVVVPVTVSGPGRVTIVGKAQAGDETITAYGTAPDGSETPTTAPARFARVTERASASAAQAGTVDVTLQLTRAARARLAAGERIDVQLHVRASNSPVALASFLTLATS